MKSCEDIPSRSKARIPWWYPEKWEKLGNVELSCFKGHRGQRRKGRLSRRCRVSKRVGTWPKGRLRVRENWLATSTNTNPTFHIH